MLDSYEQVQPAHTLRTFGDVERLWEQVVRPVLPGFLSMQNLWEGEYPAPPPGSVWHENWRLPEVRG